MTLVDHRSTITYDDTRGRRVTLPLGQDYAVKREGACLDICLSRAVAVDCPIIVKILVRTSGEVVLWLTEFREGHQNTYWHFSALSDEDATKRRPTDGQLRTLERIFLGLEELPGGIGGALGRPVASWAFVGQTPADIAAKHGVKPPAMNG